jgi:hypothetical protein
MVVLAPLMMPMSWGPILRRSYALFALRLFRLVYVFSSLIVGFPGACTYPASPFRNCDSKSPSQGSPHCFPLLTDLFLVTWFACIIEIDSHCFLSMQDTPLFSKDAYGPLKVSFILPPPFPLLCSPTSSSSYRADSFLYASYFSLSTSPSFLRLSSCFFLRSFSFPTHPRDLGLITVRERWTRGFETPGHECIKNIVTDSWRLQ